LDTSPSTQRAASSAKRACKALLPAREAAFPGALRCECCARTLLRMGAAVNPAHHGFLERAAARAPAIGPDGSVGGAFWQAVGTAACVGMAAGAAAQLPALLQHHATAVLGPAPAAAGHARDGDAARRRRPRMHPSLTATCAAA
jgi:hypothetical protein